MGNRKQRNMRSGQKETEALAGLRSSCLGRRWQVARTPCRLARNRVLVGGEFGIGFYTDLRLVETEHLFFLAYPDADNCLEDKPDNR